MFIQEKWGEAFFAFLKTVEMPGLIFMKFA
jgi:hypothetical protein